VSAVFIDSNVILYLLSADSAKADRAEAILNKGGIISVQVLNEVASVCLRKLKMTWEEIDAVLLAVKAACDVVPLTLESHEKAVQLSKRYQLSFYDANICAAAILSGVKVVLFEDMQDGMKIDALTVKNPFA
jgi:predicted nucleic acid-binding protein